MSTRITARKTTTSAAAALIAMAGLLLGGCNLPDNTAKPTTSAAQTTEPVKTDPAKPGATTANTPAPKPEEKPQTAQELLTESYAKLGYRLDWVGFATVMPGQRVKLAEVLGDLLVVQDSSSATSAIQTRDGIQRWATLITEDLTPYVGIVRDTRRVMACSESEIYLLDADSGAITGKQKLARVVNTKPAQQGPMLVFGTATGELMAHLTTSGFRAWIYGAGGPIQTTPVFMDNSVVGAVAQNGRVLMIDAGSGSSVGRNSTYAGLANDPAATGSLMIVASLDQSLYAFEANGGRTKWRIRTEVPLKSQPVVIGNTVYVEMPAGFSAIDANTGKAAWTTPEVSGTLAAIRGGKVIVWSGQTATVLDGKTGAIVEEVNLPGVAHLRADQIVDGHLYLISAAGAISKLAPR